MEGQDASLVQCTQWRDLLHVTSKFLADASDLIESHLARQRILGPSKSEKKAKTKTKNEKTGFQLFADAQHLQPSDVLKFISARWRETSQEEKDKWRLMAIQEKDHGNQVKEEPPSPPPAKQASLLQAFDAASESSSHVRQKRGNSHVERSPKSSDTEGQSSERSSSEERHRKKKKNKHKHSSESKKHA